MIIIEDFNLTDIRIWVMIIIEDFNLTVILGNEMWSLLKISIWLILGYDVIIIIEDFNLTVILGYELWSLLKILIWLWLYDISYDHYWRF